MVDLERLQQAMQQNEQVLHSNWWTFFKLWIWGHKSVVFQFFCYKSTSCRCRLSFVCVAISWKPWRKRPVLVCECPMKRKNLKSRWQLQKELFLHKTTKTRTGQQRDLSKTKRGIETKRLRILDGLTLSHLGWYLRLERSCQVAFAAISKSTGTGKPAEDCKGRHRTQASE